MKACIACSLNEGLRRWICRNIAIERKEKGPGSKEKEIRESSRRKGAGRSRLPWDTLQSELDNLLLLLTQGDGASLRALVYRKMVSFFSDDELLLSAARHRRARL